jgi:adenylate cyclase
MGVAVNAGVAYVGNVGGAVVDFTALGDTVNVGARMQGHAASGELLIREGVAAELPAHAPRRRLDLHGRDEAVDVLVMTA